MELIIHDGEVTLQRDTNDQIVATWWCPTCAFHYPEIIIGKVTADAVKAELIPHVETHKIEVHNWDHRRRQ